MTKLFVVICSILIVLLSPIWFQVVYTVLATLFTASAALHIATCSLRELRAEVDKNPLTLSPVLGVLVLACLLVYTTQIVWFIMPAGVIIATHIVYRYRRPR